MNLLPRRGRLGSRTGEARGRRACRPRGEGLEVRDLLATVSVNAGQVVRAVDTNLLGVNLVEWDSYLNTSQTQQMVQAAGLTEFRFPGGSASDDFHFNSPPAYNGQGTDTSMASFIASVNGQAIITLDYGSGSPQEAAAELAYFNGSVDQHDLDRHRPRSGATRPMPIRRSTGRPPVTGPASGPPPRSPTTTGSTSCG